MCVPKAEKASLSPKDRWVHYKQTVRRHLNIAGWQSCNVFCDYIRHVCCCGWAMMEKRIQATARELRRRRIDFVVQQICMCLWVSIKYSRASSAIVYMPRQKRHQSSLYLATISSQKQVYGHSKHKIPL